MSHMAIWKLLILTVALQNVLAHDDCSVHDDSRNGTCSSQLQRLRVGLEWFTNPDHLPLIVAKHHGLFEQFGLDVELVTPTNHWEADEEILAGRLDVAVTEPLHLAHDVANGKSVLGFSRFLHTDGGVMYKTDSGISRPRDMCGKTIAYPGSPGRGGPAIVQTMVKADGMEGCDLNSYGKYNGGFFHTDALQSGNADVATLIFWNFEIPEAKARGMNVDFFSLKDWGVPDFCQLVLFTTPSKFQEKKDLLRKLVLAMRRATRIIHQQPDVAMAYYKDYTTGLTGDRDIDDTQAIVMKETMEATLPAFPNDNTMSSDYYERLMSWLIETDQVNGTKVNALNITTDDYWTNEVAW